MSKVHLECVQEALGILMAVEAEMRGELENLESAPSASTNTGSPKLPEFEEAYNGFCAHRGGISIIEEVYDVLEDFYKYIRQLRAGA